MTAPQKPQDDLEVLLDALLAELMTMSDQQVLDGEDASAVQARGLTMLSSAKQAAAKRRLAAAKAGVAMSRAEGRSGTETPITGAQAKAYLRTLGDAANAGQFTLAARQLADLSDEDALAIYRKLIRLGARSAGTDDSP
jgi:DNA invertase Pin-like site-specific DNA recombinase